MSTPQPPDALEEWPTPAEEDGIGPERQEEPRTPPPPSALLDALPGPQSADAAPAAVPRQPAVPGAQGAAAALPPASSAVSSGLRPAPQAASDSPAWPRHPAPAAVPGRLTYGHGVFAAHPQPPVNNLAMAAFVFSFLVFPAGLALGLLALVRLDPKAERGKGLATAAVAVASVWIVVLSVLFPRFVMHEGTEKGGPAKAASPGAAQFEDSTAAAGSPAAEVRLRR